MGKRSKFKRLPKDRYDTWDPRPVRALAPHLVPGTRYAEPCAGKGDLIDQFAPYGELAWATDIDPRRGDIEVGDAFRAEIGDAEEFWTNPPWTRKILHPLIVHLSDQAPTWLLFDANWAFTAQAAPFMERCRKIVIVGRVRWIPDSKHDGMEDVSWYRFDRPVAGNRPVFYGRGVAAQDQAPRRTRRVCADCGVLIDRFAKWWLQTRQGVPSPVHRDCANPSGSRVLEAAPLLDLMEGVVR